MVALAAATPIIRPKTELLGGYFTERVFVQRVIIFLILSVSIQLSPLLQDSLLIGTFNVTIQNPYVVRAQIPAYKKVDASSRHNRSATGVDVM